MCRRTEEEVWPTVELPRQRNFTGFFNVPVQAPTRGQPFYSYYEKPLHLVAFYDAVDIFSPRPLKPPSPQGGISLEKIISYIMQIWSKQKCMYSLNLMVFKMYVVG